jgi:hypothetical protein
MGANRNTYRNLVGKPEGKRPLGRSRCWWVDNTKLDLRKIRLGVLDWIDIRILQTLVNTVMNHRVP